MKKFTIFLNILICVVVVTISSFLMFMRNQKYYHGTPIELFKLGDNFEIHQTFNFEYDKISKIIIPIRFSEKHSYKKKYKIINDNEDKIPDFLNDNKSEHILVEVNYGDMVLKKVFTIKETMDINFDIIGLNNEAWKNLKFSIQCVNCSDRYDAYLYRTDINNGVTILNDEQQSYDIYYGLSYRQPSLIFLIIVLIITIICFIKFLTKNFIKINNRVNCAIYFLCEIVNTILLSIFLQKFINIYYYYHSLSYLYLILSLSCLFLDIYILFLGIKLYSKKIEKLFLVVSIFVGILFSLFILPNGIPDENQHFYRAYTISDGNFNDTLFHDVPIESGRIFDSYKQVNEIFSKINYDSETSKVRSYAADYNFMLYMPSSMGFYTSKILHLNVMIGYYIARLLNLFITIIVGYYSIRLIPFGKTILFVYLLNPMLIQQGSTITADVLTNSFSILFISYVLSLKNRSIVSTKNKLFLFFITSILLISKVAYFPLLLLLFLPRKDNQNIFKNNRNIKYICASLILIFIMYLLITNKYYTSFEKMNLYNVLRNPMDYIFVLFNTLYENCNKYFENFFGSQLGWLKIDVFRFNTYAYILILMIAMYIDNIKLSKKQKFVFYLVPFIVMNLIFLGFYILYYNKLEGLIYGVQSRYFIPVMILPMLSLSSRFKNIRNNKILRNELICVGLIIINITCVISILIYSI